MHLYINLVECQRVCLPLVLSMSVKRSTA